MEGVEKPAGPHQRLSSSGSLNRANTRRRGAASTCLISSVSPLGRWATPDTLGAMPSRRQIRVGDVPIGGGAPVAVQSMTKTETADYEATMAQIRAIAEAGGDIVRCAVPRDDDVHALRRIVTESPIPVIADIHFNHTLALKAIDAGANCIRINPGNIGGHEKTGEVVDSARRAGVPMRIGVNSGSLPKHLHALEEESPVEALVRAALEYVELMERLEFEDFK